MKKLIKYTFCLLIIIFLLLSGYSYFGNLSAPQNTITKTIILPQNG